MSARFAELPLSLIDLLPNARAEPRSLAGQSALTESIKRYGVQTPVTVITRGDRFGLLLGNGRLASAKAAGSKTIPALVLTDEPNEADKLILQLTENLHREDLNPVDSARALKRVMELTGCTAADAVARLGYSGPSASRWLKLLDLPEDVLNKVRSGAIAASAGYVLAKVTDPVQRSLLAKETAEGRLSREGLVRKIKRIRRKGQRGRDAGQCSPVCRVTASLGRSQTVTFVGRDLTLDLIVGWLGELLARANHALAQGQDVAAFAKCTHEQRRGASGGAA